MKLYIIRHGETVVNAKRLINARNNIGLNSKGIEQAIEASKKIKQLQLDLIFCSPLKRAVETCEYVNYNKIPVIYEDRLMERDVGNIQFEKVEIIDKDIWYDKTKVLLYKNTEGFKSVLDRTSKFLDELKQNYKDKNILLVTHGDVFKAIYVYFNPKLTDEDIWKYEKANCEIDEFVFNSI